MQLPIFPGSTTLINASVGFFEKDGCVYYLHNRSPIYCHEKNDLNSYRSITGNIVEAKLCTPSVMGKALGVSRRNIQRYAKTLQEEGSDWFFSREEKRGDAHKLTKEMLDDTQRLIDEFYSVADVERFPGVTEGALRYHIRKDNIKKSGNYKTYPQPRLPSDRNQQDILACQLIGIGVTRVEQRSLAVNYKLNTPPIQCDPCPSVR